MADSASEIRALRLRKLDELRARGVNPYPDRYERTHSVAEARTEGERTAPPAGEWPPADAAVLRLAGRLMAFRDMGKLTFGQLRDHSAGIQVALSQKDVGAESYKDFLRLIDVGDFLAVEGSLFRTRTGELTVKVQRWRLLGKALRPLPEKWHGLKDQELCWRHRYLDLSTNEETRARFRLRSAVVRELRAFLDRHGFEEVETPVLMPHPSGALAKPFVAHHNSLAMDVFLRIAPETYLKRLIVGGYDRVYEIARCFRNEGMDPSHLQDFTMLEWYAAYWNYVDNMGFTERLLKHVLEATRGSLRVSFGGVETDFSGDWPRRSIRELIRERCGVDLARHETADALRAEIAARGVRLEDALKLGRGNLIDALWKKVARPHVTSPTFVIQHPADLSPLARRNDDDPAIVDRFQLVVNGWEIVNAYSELVDPVDQTRRLEEQAAARERGDEEAMVFEADYIAAMEYGMPPISGFGLGVDRFVALLSGQENLRDVVFFPLLRPMTEEGAPAPPPPAAEKGAPASPLPPGEG